MSPGILERLQPQILLPWSLIAGKAQADEKDSCPSSGLACKALILSCVFLSARQIAGTL